MTASLDDMTLCEAKLRTLNFANELSVVTLVNFRTKQPLLVPIRPGSRYKVLYVFATLPQEAVERFIETIHEDHLNNDFIQIWPVTEQQIRDAMKQPGISVYLDLPCPVGRFATKED